MGRRSPLDYLAEHSVFTLEEYRAFYASSGRNPDGAHENLSYHVRNGALRSVRRGLYARPGWVDPWLLASKFAPDAIISHDGALSFHGFVGVGNRVSLLTTKRVASWVSTSSELIIQPMQVSRLRHEFNLASTFVREDSALRVSTLEQALVDCLETLDRTPPGVDLLQLFRDCAQATHPRALATCAINRQSPLLVSRLGFFLQCSRRGVDEEVLRELDRHALPEPDYFVRSQRGPNDVLLGRWNLILPPELRAQFG
jgi:predicted transcriptional regulator of viral defense system